MRNTSAQYRYSMVIRIIMRQPCKPHVRHAQNQANQANQDGQRCALLTTKSRNTWTRATVFSSSG
jgi:hypothetical protein